MTHFAVVGADAAAVVLSTLLNGRPNRVLLTLYPLPCAFSLRPRHLSSSSPAQMLEPLYVLEHLDQWTSLRFGNFTGVSNIALEDGFLAMVSLQRQLYPALSTLGCGTDSGMLFSVQHPNKSVATARPDRGNVYIYTSHAAGDAPAIGPDGRMSDQFEVNYYQLPEPNPSTPNHVQPDFLHTDRAAAITARLGSPISTIPNYVTRTRNFFMRGLAVANLTNRDTGWATPSGTPVTVDLTLTAVKPGRARIPTPALVGDGVDGVGSGAAGRPYFHCYATILMTQVSPTRHSTAHRSAAHRITDTSQHAHTQHTESHFHFSLFSLCVICAFFSSPHSCRWTRSCARSHWARAVAPSCSRRTAS